jgi:hypothetical protein
MDWNTGLAERLQEYAFKSAGLSWMYGKDAAYYNSIERKTNIAIGVLAVISSVGISGIFALVDNRQCTEASPGFYIVTAISVVLTVTIGILNRYQASMNFNHRVGESSEKAVKYGTLHRTIKNQFNMNPENREEARSLLITTEQRFEELDREKPFLRDKTVNEWGQYLSSVGQDLNMDVIISIPDDLKPEVINDSEILGSSVNLRDVHPSSYTNTCVRINAT